MSLEVPGNEDDESSLVDAQSNEEPSDPSTPSGDDAARPSSLHGSSDSPDSLPTIGGEIAEDNINRPTTPTPEPEPELEPTGPPKVAETAPVWLKTLDLVTSFY
jgi:hypothetical protein